MSLVLIKKIEITGLSMSLMCAVCSAAVRCWENGMSEFNKICEEALGVSIGLDPLEATAWNGAQRKGI